MNRWTAVGFVASIDGTASDFSGRRGAWSSPASEYRSVQPKRIPVNINHDGRPVGQIVHLERVDGGLICVAEMDIPEPARYVRVGNENVALYDRTFFSAEPDQRDRDGRDLQLIGVAITHRSARLGATPLTWYEGDLGHRSTWQTDTFQRPLLNRASETRITRHGQPLMIRDHNPSMAQRVTTLPGGIVLHDGEPLMIRGGPDDPMTLDNDGHPTGPLWIRPSRIVSVGGRRPAHR